MTAVLLTILKIIGIVLLVILGIMLFLLAVLLFVPVRYSVKGTVDNNITAEGKISWLCSIFRYDFTFQEQELNGEVRIFGFRPKKKERISEEELEEEAVPEVKDGVEEVVSDLVSAAGEEDKSEKTPIKPEQDQEVDSHKGKQNRKSSDKNSRPSGKNIFMRMWDKIKNFMKNIKKIFFSITVESKIFMSIRKKLTGFKEFVVKVKEIVTDTKNQYAVRRLWEELLYLLKHFGFRKIHTELTFALADPAFTGQVLGVLCMMPFLYQYDFHIFPDFESESFYIRGSYDVKGRIQLIFLLVTAIRLLADKDIRSFLKKLLDHRE